MKTESPTNGTSPRGLLVLNKPTGMTSRRALDRACRGLKRCKVGHAGTLDPLASGVLVLCVGPATRLIEYVQRMPKTYRTVVLLGARSDTQDADGTVVPTEGAVAPSLEQVREAVAGQVGTILQKPPEYSALKVGGQRAYDLARAGAAVDLAPRPVTIHRIDLLLYEWPRLELEVFCEGGTYIRSIARDIGEALGCGGLVEVLVRTAIGPFTLEDAIDPESVDVARFSTLLRPMAEAVQTLPSLRVGPAEAADLAKGRSVLLSESVASAGEVAVLDPEGNLLAVGECEPGTRRLLPRRVLIRD